VHRQDTVGALGGRGRDHDSLPRLEQVADRAVEGGGARARDQVRRVGHPEERGQQLDRPGVLLDPARAHAGAHLLAERGERAVAELGGPGQHQSGARRRSVWP
jgi:hypothetical protein